MAETPRRSIRSPDRIWDPAKRKSDRTGIPISSAVNEFLWEWSRDERERELERECDCSD